MILLLLLSLQFQSNPAPAELADSASEFFLNGQYAEASEIWQQLTLRMPHRSRIAYNLAASLFMMDSFSTADSTLSPLSGDLGEDTLACAEVLTDLAFAIQTDNYSGVENSVYVLRRNISDALSPECEKTGLEAGLNWLENHDPPEDQQDQGEDQNENQQDQNEDEQEQNEDQQDQNEDEQDQNEDEQDQNENQPQPPPQIDEMTPDQAQAILDLVEENQQPEDSTRTGKTGYPSGPVW